MGMGTSRRNRHDKADERIQRRSRAKEGRVLVAGRIAMRRRPRTARGGPGARLLMSITESMDTQRKRSGGESLKVESSESLRRCDTASSRYLRRSLTAATDTKRPFGLSPPNRFSAPGLRVAGPTIVVVLRRQPFRPRLRTIATLGEPEPGRSGPTLANTARRSGRQRLYAREERPGPRCLARAVDGHDGGPLARVLDLRVGSVLTRVA